MAADLLLTGGGPTILDMKWNETPNYRDGKWIMGSTGESAERIEALRALVDRLGSPDLTLAEAKALRPRLLELTRRGAESRADHRLASPGASPDAPCGGPQHGSRSSGCRICAA